MINFGLMRVEGFASIDNETFDWGLHGLNIIQAPNGNGKTTFINALVWVIYGKTLTGSVEPWEHIRSDTYKGTKVTLEFEIHGCQYKITRYLGYSKEKNSLYIHHEEGEFEGDKKEKQAKIEYIIGYTYELFKNSIIFGQKLKRLIAETGPNKKKIFDDAFELSYIPKAKKYAEDKLSEYSREYGIQEKVVIKSQGKLSSKMDQINSEKSLVENFEENKKKEINKIDDKILILSTKLSKSLEENPDMDSELKVYEDKNKLLMKDFHSDSDVMKLEKELTKQETKLEQEESEADDNLKSVIKLNKELKNLPQVCPSCGRPFEDKHKKMEVDRIEAAIQILNNDYKSFLNTISIIQGDIKQINSTISSAKKVKESIDSNNLEIEKLESILELRDNLKLDIRKLRKEIRKINKRKLDNNIQLLEQERLEYESELKKENSNLKRIKRDIRTYQWLIKDPLSNSGLRAFIYNQMLDSVNERLEYYTKFTGFQVTFFIDMQSGNKNIETYVFRGNQPVPYNDLSGGQQQSVDIASAFAIHDIVSDTKECSLLVMDEVFESLDKDNIEIMTELIQDKAQSKSLYLVTHRVEFNPTNANIIRIEYDGRFTSVA